MIAKFIWASIILELVFAQQFNRQPQQQNFNPQHQQNVGQNQFGQQRQPFNNQNQPRTGQNQGQSFVLGGSHNQPNQQNQPNQLGQQNPPYQGYNYNPYYGQHHQQQGNNPQTGILTNPIRPRAGGYQNFSNVIGATLYFKINGYNNQGMKMPGGRTCVCPSGATCTFLQNVPNPCLVAFTAIMTSSDQNVQYVASDFVPYNASTISLGNGNWNQDNNIQMATKPQSIDIFVHNLGVSIDSSSGNLMYFNYLTKVDTFVIDLRGYSPATSSQQPQTIQQTYTGQDVQSTLDFSYYVQCQQGYMGPLCDLQCSSNSSDNTHVVCTSSITNQQSICNYTDSAKTQVGNCQVCINGVYNFGCADVASAYNLESNKVSKAFKVWTIVLAILLGFAVVFIILLLILFLIVRGRSNKQASSSYSRQPGGYSAGYNSRAPNTVTNPLLTDRNKEREEWNRSNPPVALTRGPHADMETTQSTEAPRGTHYSPRREAEV